MYSHERRRASLSFQPPAWPSVSPTYNYGPTLIGCHEVGDSGNFPSALEFPFWDHFGGCDVDERHPQKDLMVCKRRLFYHHDMETYRISFGFLIDIHFRLCSNGWWDLMHIVDFFPPGPGLLSTLVRRNYHVAACVSFQVSTRMGAYIPERPARSLPAYWILFGTCMG